ncbi:GNAT family N-acetyltransferase [Pseudalkalibacillus sp. R45]|uniref:GNAT family N-acetyltransferase n=1 Tax=Pseudalkalibacillus sp. R45 TaxID=3457433 RepID=UPI003FCDD7FF
MDFRQYQEASGFANNAEAFLQKDEALNNLPLGILNRCIQNEKQGINAKSAPIFATITDDDQKLVLVLIMTPPFNLGVFGDSSHIKINEAIEHAIANLKEMPLIVGTRHLAGTFAEKWCSDDKIIYETAMEQCILKLTKVNDVPQSPGFIRLATMEDHELLSKWGHDFSFVTETPFTIAEAKEKKKEFIHQESLYVWVDGEPVSMARKARGTSKGMSVNYVYTPKKYEKRGYATSCVSQLSRMLLKEGYEFCTLYTDLSNPTSNSIYKRIGYRPIGDSIVYQFKSI